MYIYFLLSMGLSACIAVQSADDYSCIQVNEGLGDFEGGGDQKLLHTSMLSMLLPLVILDMDQLTGIKSVEFFNEWALLIFLFKLRRGALICRSCMSVCRLVVLSSVF